MIKIFDPFYTSKDVGKGLGLGLSVVHNIIEAHGGNVHIESDPGEFCEFQIYFPAPQQTSYSEIESLSTTSFLNN
jgi:signal transduction histidine kinase